MLTAEARRRGEQPRTEDRKDKTLPLGGRSGDPVIARDLVIGKPEMLQPQGTLRKKRKGVQPTLVKPLILFARIPKSARKYPQSGGLRCVIFLKVARWWKPPQ
jgi:hypothetical protein